MGTPEYAHVANKEGAVWLYRGSPAGVCTTHSAILGTGYYNARFGQGVSGAGDVNGDGYSDVVIGAWGQDAAFVFHGAPSGLELAHSQLLEADQGAARFGECVRPAGDVNGDGFSDVVVGGPNV